MRSQLLTDCPPHAAQTPASCQSAESPRFSLWTRLGHLVAWTGLAMQIRRERKQLSALTDRELTDIGVSREEADRESYRGLSNIPPNRLRRTKASQSNRR